LTIELRDSIPLDLRPGIGDWLFGCDVCQEVCPWNQSAERRTVTGETTPVADVIPTFAPAVDANPIDLIALFDLDDEAFRRRFRDTPLWRAKRRGILRNAAIVLGNQQQAAAATTALTKGLTDPEPLVREACGWALARIRE
jgi:epoxyqueuosine reductase